jgi:hypothetical protein
MTRLLMKSPTKNNRPEFGRILLNNVLMLQEMTCLLVEKVQKLISSGILGTVPFFAENNCPLKNNQNCLLKTYQYLAMISAN